MAQSTQFTIGVAAFCTDGPCGKVIRVKLGCTLEEFDQLEMAEETHFLPGGGIYPGYAASQVFAMPYYGLGLGTIAPPVITDAVPLGEVTVRRGEHVHATDGEIGRVQGLVIEPENHHGGGDR